MSFARVNEAVGTVHLSGALDPITLAFSAAIRAFGSPSKGRGPTFGIGLLPPAGPEHSPADNEH
jgi:hypothetical protein